MNAYTLKAWLKDNTKVHKEIRILSTHTFKDLHHTLMRAFEMGMIKAVCFYMCTRKWKRRQKISFSNPGNEKGVIAMEDAVLGNFIKNGATHICYECKNGAEWMINIQVIGIKKPSPAKRYPDWDDTSGQSLKHLIKRVPVMVVEEEFQEEPEEEPEEQQEGEDNFGKDFEDLEVEDNEPSEEPSDSDRED